MSSKKNPDAKDDWQTPKDILATIQAFGSYMGTKGVTLDPATTEANPTRSERIRTPQCDPDGLQSDWWYVAGENALIYVNPPYRTAWYKKIGEEAARLLEGQHMIALLPAKVGTQYFQDLVEHASAIAFVRGRLTFEGADDQAPFESALLYFGKKPHQFRAHFEKYGWCV